MCRLCLPRRSLLLAPALLPFRAAAATTDAPVEPHMRLANVPADRLTVALTLDACPGAFDERIALALVESRIPATIFVTAVWMHRNPGALTFLLANKDLFAIENHGAQHIAPVFGVHTIYGIPVAGNPDTVQREVIDGATAIQARTGVAPRWYRAATGFYSPSAIPLIQQLGFSIGAYSFSADQGASLPAAAVASRIAKASNGDVIVAHINQPHRPSGAGVVLGSGNCNAAAPASSASTKRPICH